MGFLSGSPTINTTTRSSAPWVDEQPYIREIMSGAQQAYQSDAPSYFPQSTVIGFSPQTQGALQATESRALSGSPLQRAGMDQALSTVQGDYLNANPFLTGAYNAASAPVIEQWRNQIAPGIDSSFSRAGRLGSGAYAQARNTSESTLGRSLTDMSSKMAYANYAAERQNQLSTARAAPGMAQSDYSDMNQLMSVGAAREGLEQAQLQDRISRFNWEQERPWNQLARYSGLVSGGYGMQEEVAEPIVSDARRSFLSGALGGAQLGSMIGTGYPGYGAIAGGLLGLF